MDCRSLFSVLVLAVVVYQAQAIGFCNNTLVKNILATNGCPEKSLEFMYNNWPSVNFRVLASSYTNKARCHTGILERPKDNAAIFRVNFTFNRNGGIAYRNVNYTMVEAKCGLVFKYDEARSFVSFKMVFSYADGLTFGYYGCSNEVTDTPNEIYAACVSTSENSPLVEESVRKCKKHMEDITGATDLSLLPHCVPDKKC